MDVTESDDELPSGNDAGTMIHERVLIRLHKTSEFTERTSEIHDLDANSLWPQQEYVTAT